MKVIYIFKKCVKYLCVRIFKGLKLKLSNNGIKLMY